MMILINSNVMSVTIRQETYAVGSEDVVMHHLPKDTPEYPARVETLLSTGGLTYSPYFEAYTPNSDRSRRWKSFQHYKSVQEAPSTQTGAVDVFSESVGFYPNHYSQGVSQHPFVGYYKYTTSGRTVPFGDPGRLDNLLPALYVPQPNGDFVLPPDDLNSLEQRALGSMLPLIKSELSLPNFLLELKDFKPVIRNVKRLVTSKSFLKTIKELSIGKNLSLMALARKVSAGYLNYSFAIAPLISDIRKIHNAVTKSLARLNEFVTNQGRPQTKHFRFSWDEFERVHVDDPWWYGSPSAEVLNTWGISICGCKRYVTTLPTVFHAQIEYNYNYTQYQVEHARLLGYLDALGVNLNPAIIWNALPWTFVIDWVISIGNLLDELKVENMRPQINIRQYLWSVSRGRVITAHRAVRLTNTQDEFWVRMPTVRQTAYRRQVGMPSASSIQSSGLTLKEVSLGAALVVARRR